MTPHPASPSTPLLGLANILASESSARPGWARIPYGEWPHEEGLQRFGRAEADEMVGYFRNGWNTLKRAVSGLPIFKGHPDLAPELRRQLPRIEDSTTRRRLETRIAALDRQYPDTARYGAIGDMEARDDGLYLRPVLADTGSALVRDQGLKCFSPHWLAQRVENPGGRPVFRPVALLSIGLTDRPNIAGTSLVNQQPALMHQALLLELLAALGRELPADATPEQIEAELTAAIPVATALRKKPVPTEDAALANEKAVALANELTALRTELGVRKSEIENQKSKIENLASSLANERTAHAAITTARDALLVATAIREGRIPESARPVWLSRLARDFTTESAALANESAALKTAARTQSLGDHKPANAAADEFTALVNEALPRHGHDWARSWAAVKSTPRGQSLYARMQTTTPA